MVVALACVSSGGALAQRMAAADLVRHVIAVDPQLAARRANVRAADGDRLAVQSALYPSIDVSSQIGRAGQKDLPTPSQFSANDGVSRPAYSRSLTISQLLFDSGKSAMELEIARTQILREAIALEKAVNERSLAALQAMLDLAAAREKLSRAKATQGRLEHLVELVQGRMRSGQAPLVELRRSQSRLLEQRRAVAELEGTARQAVKTFSQVTQLDPAKLELIAPPDAAPDIAELEHLRSACEVSCVDVKDAETAVRIAELQLKAMASGFLPKVVLQASASRALNPGGAQAHYASRTVGLVASWNLFAGGGDVGRRRAAAERLDSGRSQKDAVVIESLGQFDRVQQLFLTASEVEQLGKSAAEIASDTRSLAEKGYEAGVRPLLDVADTLVEENRAQAALIDAGTQKNLAWFHLLALHGELARRIGAVDTY
ncbi:TolC family protein [Caenimonas aquaedulcis]|uniref:TolC family protein n=1 Tax=Caenimonas aquaedulcis TaxID=2793270 RepID=A0A931H7V5_9BURK|nr:TolC family protein [Caenimonas aquaedulcis]MBG9390042.1 TolC family protein [Caenimonas aquaedulcis]